MSDELPCRWGAQVPLSRAPSGSPATWLARVIHPRVSLPTLTLLATLAQGCQGTGRPTSVGDQAAAPPASSAERAVARAERQARQDALEEQGDRPEAPAEPDEVDTPEPSPPQPPEPVASTTPSEPVDAGVPDGAVDAAVAPVEAGPPSLETLCHTLCARAIACALEMVEETAGGLDPDLLERMQEEMREGETRCREECATDMDVADQERMTRAGACLDEKDCEAFLTCMREVLDE